VTPTPPLGQSPSQGYSTPNHGHFTPLVELTDHLETKLLKIATLLGKIIGAAYTVLNKLKPGLNEKLYERALIIQLGIKRVSL